MNIKEVLADLDELFESHRIDEVEEFLQDKLLQAKKEKDTSSMITIVNELIGFYRDMSQYEQAIAYCNQIIALMKQCGYEGTVPYATTLLNVANAKRAAGMWNESEEAYQEVARIYKQSIDSNDFRYASLYNNWSLLYQEQQKYEEARDSLKKALGIISQYNNTQIEIATTHTNLATTLLRLGDIKEAMDHLIMALSIFEEDEGKDYHYSAALSAMGDAKYLQGEYQAAADYYEQAMEQIALHVGRTESYERIAENLKIVQGKMNQQEPAKKEDDEEDTTYEQIHEKNQVQFLLEQPSEDDFEDDYDIDCDDDFERNDYELDEEDYEETNEQIEPQEDIEDHSLELEKKGLVLSEEFYENYGKAMIHEKFPEYESKIAVGMVGEGSECYGFDDYLSMDHDYGAGFCMWVTKETYNEIGEDLQKAYEELVEESGYQLRKETPEGKSRVGVAVIEDFYKRLIGFEGEPQSEFDWYQIPDGALASATNGKVFRDDEQIFSAIRTKIQNLYPEKIRLYKIAEKVAKISQTGQYNYARMMIRKDYVTARIALTKFMSNTMSLVYLLNRTYEPYYKWQREGIKNLPVLAEIGDILDAMVDMPDQRKAWEGKAASYNPSVINTTDQIQLTIEVIGKLLLEEMKLQNLVQGEDNYLDHHREEILSIADDPLQIAKVRQISKERLEEARNPKQKEMKVEEPKEAETIDLDDFGMTVLEETEYQNYIPYSPVIPKELLSEGMTEVELNINKDPFLSFQSEEEVVKKDIAPSSVSEVSALGEEAKESKEVSGLFYEEEKKEGLLNSEEEEDSEDFFEMPGEVAEETEDFFDESGETEETKDFFDELKEAEEVEDFFDESEEPEDEPETDSEDESFFEDEWNKSEEETIEEPEESEKIGFEDEFMSEMMSGYKEGFKEDSIDEAQAIADSIEAERLKQQQEWIQAAQRETDHFYQPEDNQELVDKIVLMEWKQFDEVQNEGGRADCQDDWNTFSIMRKSQYMAWTTDVLESFYQDLSEAEAAGWNLITEKYARMMESTAPQRYQEIKDTLPAMSEEKKKVSEQIIQIQVEWMEDFAKRYPMMAGNARSVHTSEDNEYNTSYETYLRGELGTYSDETLALYGKMIVDLSKDGKNLAELIMTNTALLYGYASLNDAEEKLAKM